MFDLSKVVIFEMVLYTRRVSVHAPRKVGPKNEECFFFATLFRESEKSVFFT